MILKETVFSELHSRGVDKYKLYDLCYDYNKINLPFSVEVTDTGV